MNTISTKKKVVTAILASALALGVSGSAMAANDTDANAQGTRVAKLTAIAQSFDASKLSPEDLAECEKMRKDVIYLDNSGMAIASTEAIATVEASILTGGEMGDLPEGVVKMEKVELGEGEAPVFATMVTVVEN